jgi:arylsulfatase A-like enzyme
MGGITEMATSAPGYTSVRPNTCAPLAEILKLNGYATAQFGKCHEVPTWETSPAGPFDRWPTGAGFEHFYGFVGGETDQWFPTLVEGTSRKEPWGTPEEGYHFTEDLTEKAIAWCVSRRRWCRTNRSSCTSPQVRRTRRTMSRSSGPTSTRANSTTAGTGCANARSPGRRSWASSLVTPS